MSVSASTEYHGLWPEEFVTGIKGIEVLKNIQAPDTREDYVASILNKSFKKEFAGNPSSDPIWANVMMIGLNCLKTGCLILIRNELAKFDEQIKFRFIPNSLLTPLRRAAVCEDGELEAKVSEAAQAVIQGIRINPAEFYPEPFVVENHPYLAYGKVWGFEALRESYNRSEDGIPNTPGKVLDVCVILRRTYVLYKGDMNSAGENTTCFNEYVNHCDDMPDYREFANKLDRLKLSFSSENEGQVGAPLSVLWLIGASVMNEKGANAANTVIRAETRLSHSSGLLTFLGSVRGGGPNLNTAFPLVPEYLKQEGDAN